MANKKLREKISEAVSLKDTATSRKLYKEMRYSEIFVSIFSVFGIISASVDYEKGYSLNRNHSNCFENPIQIYRYFTLIFTLIAIFFLVLRHNSKVKWWNKAEFTYYSNQTAASHKRRNSLISIRLLIEIILLIVFPYPYLKGTFTYMETLPLYSNEKLNNSIELCYNISEIFYGFMFFRVFFIIRTCFNFTQYQDDHARFYCNKYKTIANLRFTIKCIIKIYPIRMVCIITIVSICVLGLVVRVIERPFSDTSRMNFASFENGLWACAVSITAVGYGYVYPTTSIGRIIAISCAMWGVCIFSVIVFTLKRMLILDKDQRQAFNSIKQTRSAASVIIACLTYQIYKKKYGRNSLEARAKIEIVYSKLKDFNETMKKLKEVDNFIKDLHQASRFRNVTKEVNELQLNIDKLIQKYAG